MIFASKRGVVFTIMAIVIAAVIIAGAAVLSPVQVERESAELFRVNIVSNIVSSFDEYATTSLRTATRSSLDEVTDFLAQEDGDEDFSENSEQDELTIFFEDHDEFENAVATCFVGGAKSGIQLAGELPLSDSELHCNGNNFTALLREYQALVLEAYNVNISGFDSIDKATFSISQDTLPFRARANITLPEITVRDPASGAQWILPEKNLSTTVPIDGLKDPLVEKAAQSTSASSGFSRPIKPFANAAGSFSEPKGFEEVYSVLQNESYFAWSQAPSYLERFYMHNATASSAGIVSFVDGNFLYSSSEAWTADVASDGTPRSNYSHIDFDILYGGEHPFEPKTYGCDEIDSQVWALDNGTVNTTQTFWVDAPTLSLFAIDGSNWTGC